jgi:NAD(P)-dependent dehydrogenase (short-subunit alcohol dehydrogenase family)
VTKLKPLSEQVIVITGGSSGIGLATAKTAAAHGAKVVMAARTRPALAAAVDQINQAGGPGSASFVEADVGERAAHERIAAHALERHGRIDSWVNCAGVLVFGRLEAIPEADMRRLFETNFWGVVHGSLVAADHMRGDGGAIINIGSIESERGVPLQGIYAASKHAVKGFTEILRAELEADGAPISVTLIKPGSISSPIERHTRSYEGVEPQLPPPHYSPEEAARVILRAAERPLRTAYVGGMAQIVAVASATAPKLVDWITETLLVSGQRSARPDRGDNLEEGMSEAQVHGVHGSGRPSLYSAAARHKAVTLAAFGAAAAGAFLLTRSSKPDRPARDEEAAGAEMPLEAV